MIILTETSMKSNVCVCSGVRPGRNRRGTRATSSPTRLDLQPHPHSPPSPPRQRCLCIKEASLEQQQQLRCIQTPPAPAVTRGASAELRCRVGGPGIHRVSRQNPIKLMTSLSKWIVVHALINSVTGVHDKLSPRQKVMFLPRVSLWTVRPG